MQNKLIIWDFDGVIADSEYLWVRNWTEVLHKVKNIALSKEQQRYYLEGKAEKTKIFLLQQDYPQLQFDDTFWQEVRQNEEILIKTELKLTPGVLDLLNNTKFARCIATGATPEKHLKKVQQLNLSKYFDKENTFTAYDVAKGKPAPDLFLFAAQQMGFEPKNCVVIEDSLAGIAAGVAAGMIVIAYIGASGHLNDEYAKQCQLAGANYVARSMSEVDEILQHISKY